MTITRKCLTPLIVLCFSAGTANAIPINTTLDSLDETTLGSFQGFGTFDFEILNNTGITWTDFHFFDSEPIGVIDIESYVGPGTASFDDELQIDILGLNIADGETLVFSIDENCGIAETCSLGGAIWQGFPTVDGDGDDDPVDVPEPSTLALFGFGLLGAGVAARRRRSTA